MKEYFLTIRKHQVKDYVCVEDLLDVLKCLGDLVQIKVLEITYEIDPKYQQLHSHIIIQTKRFISYRKLTSIHGFRIYWKFIKDKLTTLCYMHKDSCNEYEQQQVIISNYYRHHYGFV